MTDETKQMMIERDKSRDTAVTSSLREDWQLYRTARNKCTAAVTRNRKDYWKDKFSKFQQENNVKGLYSQIKQQMGWKEAGPPNALLNAGNIVRKPQQIANVQNRYYKQKLIELEDKLPRNSDDPLKILKAAFTRWGRRSDNIQKLKIQPVGIEHTKKLIRKLGVSAAAGHEGIESTSLKLVTEEVAAPLNFIINLSTSTSTFANKWKLGRVIPLLKGSDKDRNEPSSYRPVSMLPVISKTS